MWQLNCAEAPAIGNWFASAEQKLWVLRKDEEKKYCWGRVGRGSPCGASGTMEQDVVLRCAECLLQWYMVAITFYVQTAGACVAQVHLGVCPVRRWKGWGGNTGLKWEGPGVSGMEAGCLVSKGNPCWGSPGSRISAAMFAWTSPSGVMGLGL